MRARKKKNLIPRLERCEKYAVEKISPSQDGRPIWVEIGCGKGKMAAECAETGKMIYYGVEKIPDVVVMAIEKAAEKELDNLRFVIGDATVINEICPDNTVDVLFLTFSDPWPKKKHAKRRLTHRSFLARYGKILKDDGYIFFKSDNKHLFDFTLEEAVAAGYELFDVTENLHESGIYNPGMTEYEIKFSSEGLPIYHCKMRKTSNVLKIDEQNGDIGGADTGDAARLTD